MEIICNLLNYNNLSITTHTHTLTHIVNDPDCNRAFYCATYYRKVLLAIDHSPTLLLLRQRLQTHDDHTPKGYMHNSQIDGHHRVTELLVYAPRHCTANGCTIYLTFTQHSLWQQVRVLYIYVSKPQTQFVTLFAKYVRLAYMCLMCCKSVVHYTRDVQ